MTKAEQVAQALIQAKGLHYGPRHGDPTQQKGSGFYGPLPRPDGRMSTEVSGSLREGGPEFPLIYSGIPPDDLQALLTDGPITEDLYQRAATAAADRQQFGLPAFALEGEQGAYGAVAPPTRYGLFPRKPFGRP